MRVALWVIVLIFIPLEFQHIYLACQTPEPLISWLASMNSEWVYHLVWAIWGIMILRGKVLEGQNDVVSNNSFLKEVKSGLDNHQQKSKFKQKHMIAGCCGLLTLAVNLYVAWSLGDHHPVYHDEYSYLFQAETFLQGRLSNPRFEPAPELFDQVHVLNLTEGHFASRYFPAVGLFILPGIAWGLPHLAHWFAGSLITYFIVLTAYELKNDRAAWWSGIICALLPGYPLFANLLLSHHPTLLGLCWFLYWQLRLMKSPSLGCAIAAGVGLSFAMLCRPMTAAGFAFPFGVWWVIYLIVLRSPTGLFDRIVHTLGMGFPLVVGVMVMLVYSQATTGSYWQTPYQQYTDNYTPSHVYGFYNKSRGEAKIKLAKDKGHPLPVLVNYDQWAEELTPLLALQKAYVRLQATAIWTLGIIPVLLVLIVYVLTWRVIEARTSWIMAAIVSLHIAHIPYWYEGIFYWHYVLESGVLLALLMGLLSTTLLESLPQPQLSFVRNWWYGGFVITVLTSYTTFEPFWSAWLDKGISQIQYSDQKFAEVERVILETCRDRPSLVVIKPDPADVHMDFVVNLPDLHKQKILRARYLPERYPLRTLPALFPDREVWLYDVQSKTMRMLGKPIS